MQVYSTVEKECADKPYSTENSRNCFKPFFFQFIYGFVVKKNDETCRTHAKKYLHSICLQIHADYVTFLFEKKKKIFAKRM